MMSTNVVVKSVTQGASVQECFVYQCEQERQKVVRAIVKLECLLWGDSL